MNQEKAVEEEPWEREGILPWWNIVQTPPPSLYSGLYHNHHHLTSNAAKVRNSNSSFLKKSVQ